MLLIRTCSKSCVPIGSCCSSDGSDTITGIFFCMRYPHFINSYQACQPDPQKASPAPIKPLYPATYHATPPPPKMLISCFLRHQLTLSQIRYIKHPINFAPDTRCAPSGYRHLTICLYISDGALPFLAANPCFLLVNQDMIKL